METRKALSDDEITPVGADPFIKWDERDYELVRAALDNRKQLNGPLVGDYVIFADGVMRRVSYIWPESVQTSDGGSYYLSGDGHMSMSGNLYTSVPLETLTDTGTTRPAYAWIFHHGWAQASNGVHFTIPVRVYNCSLPSTETH
jgi:hypothetical protein